MSTAIINLASDVAISALADGDILVWSDSLKKWQNSVAGAVTVGTITATTGNITTINSTTVNGTTVNVGANGTAGTLNVYSPGSGKGHLAVTMGNQTGNTTISQTYADQNGNRTLTIPAASANCSYVLTAVATQAITGNVTVSGLLQGNGTVSVGADASAGTLSIYPATTARGHTNFTMSDQTGNTTIINNFADQAGNRTLTIPATSANCSYVLGAVASQTITGNLTVTATLQGNGTIQAGLDASAGTISIYPATTASGHTNITMSNNAGNTTTVLNVAAQAAARTYTLPDAKGNGTVAMSSGANLNIIDIYQCTGQITKNANTTYIDVTGLTGMAVAVGVYKFRLTLPCTVASASGGIKYCFNYTTAVLSAMESSSVGYATGVAPVNTHVTSTTTQADLFTAAAVFTLIEIMGTFTVSTAGTVAVQMAQNTSNASNTVALTGATAEFIRIS